MGAHRLDHRIGGPSPVPPRSGARKIATLAMMPALSMRSPTRTMLPVMKDVAT